jgi:SET domain-containing protein
MKSYLQTCKYDPESPFRKQGVEEKINLQCDGNKAKVYQVRQVRAVILKYRLGGER